MQKKGKLRNPPERPTTYLLSRHLLRAPSADIVTAMVSTPYSTMKNEASR